MEESNSILTIQQVNTLEAIIKFQLRERDRNPHIMDGYVCLDRVNPLKIILVQVTEKIVGSDADTEQLRR